MSICVVLLFKRLDMEHILSKFEYLLKSFWYCFEISVVLGMQLCIRLLFQLCIGLICDVINTCTCKSCSQSKLVCNVWVFLYSIFNASLCGQDGADIYLEDHNGNTPVKLAKGRKYKDLIEYFDSSKSKRSSYLPAIDFK